MKKKRNGETWSPSWVLTALVLATISLVYAWVSYQSLVEWKGLRSRLEVYDAVDFLPLASVPNGAAGDMEEAISNLIDTYGLTLLSWHQARQGDGQTLMMAGPFSSILSWLNDWQKAFPHGSVKVIEWVPTGESTAITVEVYGATGKSVKDKKVAERGS